MNDEASPQRGQITVERHGVVLIVSFRGEHDVATADLVRDLLDEAGREVDIIVVDLTAVTFMDSTIVGVLFTAYQAADTPPKIRFVAAPHTQPRDMLTMTGLDPVLPLYDRLEDALGDQEVGEPGNGAGRDDGAGDQDEG